MFQLVAVLAFFILGLAFFVIGKDDFGIKRIKENSNDNSSKNSELESLEGALSNGSNKDRQEVSKENQLDSNGNLKISD